MPRLRCLLLVLTCAAAAAGCAPDQKYIRMPRLFGPGSEREQQASAVRYDPYPENETAPAIVGGRPREYTQPLPEVVRSRWERPAPPGVHVPYPAPGTAAASAPSGVASPFSVSAAPSGQVSNFAQGGSSPSQTTYTPPAGW